VDFSISPCSPNSLCPEHLIGLLHSYALLEPYVFLES
jgi:hypothetical protein